MDKDDLKHATRTLHHIRTVQGHMMGLIRYHAKDLELSPEDCWELLQNLVRHDLSKWTPEQFHPYCDKYVRNLDNDEEYQRAWVDHYTSENHHYQRGKELSRLELIEVCCDIQAMADEFGEGSCRGYWNNKWLPGLKTWLQDNNDTDLYRQLSEEGAWSELTGYMDRVIGCLEQFLDLEP